MKCETGIVASYYYVLGTTSLHYDSLVSRS